MPLLPSVTQESIRLWAYDPELYFRSIKEEELLQQTDWLPLLITLAGDTACPKQQKIETIIEDFIQQSFLERKGDTLQEIHTILGKNRQALTTEWLILMMVTFSYIYGIFQQPQRLTEAACDKIAKELLQGSQSEKNYEKEEALEDGTRVYATALEALKKYLYINPSTGEWKTSKYLRWKTFTNASTL